MSLISSNPCTRFRKAAVKARENGTNGKTLRTLLIGGQDEKLKEGLDLNQMQLERVRSEVADFF